MISHFVALKLCAKAIHGSRPVFYLMQLSYYFCFGKLLLHLFLDIGQKLHSFSANMLAAMQLGKNARCFFFFFVSFGLGRKIYKCWMLWTQKIKC